ncbi:MAG TPA: PEP/pyruvate-binding domain-containing protein [Ktedonobacteraceae bacterium]|nr:PEP/pyruvate-binding domain-containing protein [Ktedonobacteraceae bacterium]
MMVPSTLAPLVLTFQEIDASMLTQVGGKAANLGELTHAGLSVPPGFCVTTTAYALAASKAGLEPILEQLASTRSDERAQLESCAATARSKLLAIAIPDEIAEAITQVYQVFASGVPIPVAVRSSATAEDLPFASFAGQQETYLNIVGIEAVLDAVRRCWASLWTDRAVSYRASNQVDHRTVRLAVVVQQMVEAEVAGVLFTANPLTGHRRQAVIDANPGLGEAVVSGAVNPDHFVVNTTTEEILERRLGDKRVLIRAAPGGGTQRVEVAERNDKACISDEQVHALARLGTRVEAHYGSPQDIEWAIDSSGYLWLTQARPITTLFPLPANAPITDDELHVYLSISVLQGVYRPLTPMGMQIFRLLSSAATAFALGRPPKNPLAGLPLVVDIGQRLFLDATPALRDPLGREVVIRILQGMEAQSAVIFQQLIADPRLRPITKSKVPTLRKLFPIALRTQIPLRIVGTLLRPQAARKRLAEVEAYLRQQHMVSPGASSTERLDAVERHISLDLARVARTVLPTALAGIVAVVLAPRLMKRIATRDEVQTVLRSLPYNPTTEMDLSLWALAQQIGTDPAVADKVRNTPPEQLAQAYRERQLPSLLQQGLTEFLRRYGHRAVAEIDLGLARWSEDPTHILGVLANYLQIKNPELAPDVQFARGAREAEAMVMELIRRARRKGWFYSKLVRFDLKRIRELTGIREVPKFCFILLLARCRKLLWAVGEELAQAERMQRAADIFFVTLPEARAALAGEDLRPLVRERRASYEQELSRRHIPRVLLSDGTEPTPERHTTEIGDSTLRGTPASAGVVTGRARVILDAVGAHLEPGEILVAPSTDPGWTPLFLTAGGLVMEMGGSMSHGSVVAREYGIPAVVGVHGATAHIVTGQHITVDGSKGVIVIGQEESGHVAHRR